MQRYAFGLSLVFGAAFLAVVAFMQFDPDDFVMVDALAKVFVTPLQTFGWVQFFIVITTLGSTVGVLAIAALTIFLIRREYNVVLRLVIALAGSSAMAQVVKSFIGRIRPDALPWIGSLHSFSFPSGHSTSAAALFGFIAVICASRLPKPYERILAVGLCGLLILGIGASRIVLAAHYFSDVIAGFLLGALWVALAFSLPLGRWNVFKLLTTSTGKSGV